MAAKLAEAAGLPVSAQTIHRELARNVFCHECLPAVHAILPENRKKCLAFACQFLQWQPEDWNKVIFTDEKKWNLIGNDGYVSARVQNHAQYQREKVQFLHGSLMTWAAISASKVLMIVHVEGKIDSPTYCEMLEETFFNNADIELPLSSTFSMTMHLHMQVTIQLISWKTMKYASRQLPSLF